MSDEPGHKAMLYFLEVLMNSNGPLTVSQLAGRFGSSNFTSEMRTAAGGNESGLKQFLQKYPSLFTIKSNMVSLYDGGCNDDDDSSVSSEPMRSLPDVSLEMEAVQFFQSQLARREERWVPIKSLAGHLSQASSDVRNVVGPQLEFRNFLLRHMHIFEVDGDNVCLREGLAPPTTPNRRITFDLPTQDPVPPKTPPPIRKSNSKNGLHRSHSFGDRNQLGSKQKHDSPVTMTANEYKAVMYIKELLETKGRMSVSSVITHLAQSSDSVRSTLGNTVLSLENFLKKNSVIFQLDSSSEGDSIVELVKNAKLTVIITGSRPSGPSGPPAFDSKGPLHEGKGKIFHVAKLWGIIDLGDHEHVFFDRSIMNEPIDDLQKHFHIGETLCFKAVPAHKTSRARWRATQVWYEGSNEMPAVVNGSMHDGKQVEGEVNEFLPNVASSNSLSGQATGQIKYSDAKLSGAGSVQIWNFKGEETRNKRVSMSVVPESYQMSASALNDMRYVPGFETFYTHDDTPDESQDEGSTEKKYESVACQTVSTGDIIATQLYQSS